LVSLDDYATDKMDTTTPPRIEQRVRLRPILRDVAIIVALTFLGGCIMRAVRSSSREMLVANLVLTTVGFVISGCLAVGSRWRHLAYVGLGVWLAGLMNVLFFGVSIVYWPFSIIFVALTMRLGGAMSYVFKRDTNRSF